MRPRPPCLLLCCVLALVVASLARLSRAGAVGGISGSKLATPCTAAVPVGQIEVEPYFGVDFSKHTYGGDWSSRATGARERTVEVGFRSTLGFAAGWEVGLIVPVLYTKTWGAPEGKLQSSGLGDIPVGVKWEFWTIDALQLAAQLGATLPTGDFEPSTSENALGEGAVVPELGLIATIKPLERLSVDISIAGAAAVPVDEGETTWSGVLDIAVGWELGPIQPIVELNQVIGGWPGATAYKLTTNIGFTYQLNEAVILVTGPWLDLVGRNETRSAGYNLALTLLL